MFLISDKNMFFVCFYSQINVFTTMFQTRILSTVSLVTTPTVNQGLSVNLTQNQGMISRYDLEYLNSLILLSELGLISKISN